jgi:hypothetical protein
MFLDPRGGYRAGVQRAPLPVESGGYTWFWNSMGDLPVFQHAGATMNDETARTLMSMRERLDRLGVRL